MADTLRATNIKLDDDWTMSGLGGDKEDRVNDEDDGTYVYSGTANQYQGFLTGNMSVEYPDSFQYWVRAAYNGGSAGTARIAVGRSCYATEFSENYWCISDYDDYCTPTNHSDNSADTLTLTGSATNHWVMTYITEPCYDGGTLDSTWFNESAEAGGWHDNCFTLENIENRTGLPAPSNRVYEVYVIYFYEEEAEGNPRRNRLLRSKHEEDYHDPVHSRACWVW